jgi:hypothetical protein
MKKVITALFGALLSFSCSVQPDDWDERLDFTDKPYTGAVFNEWDDFTEAVMDQVGEYVHNIEKSQSWKGVGRLSGAQSAYYIFKAQRSVKIIIDWRERETTNVNFDYKTVGNGVTKYGVQTTQITMAANDYLVIRISSPNSKDLDWELGFTVN